MDKDITWHGNSLDAVKAFPSRARQAVGIELRRLQKGLDPTNWKPMKTIGPGVREVRVNVGGAFRVIYLEKRGDGVHVLHAFTKKSRRTSVGDIRIASERFKSVQRDRN